MESSPIARSDYSAEHLAYYVGKLGIPGVGPGVGRRIVDAFGWDALTMIDRADRGLVDKGLLRGAAIEHLMQNYMERTSWSSYRDVSLLMVKHCPGALRKAPDIKKAFGYDAVRQISSDPYKLTLTHRILSFRQCDEIAKSLGLDMKGPNRHQAALLACLDTAAQQNGACGVEAGDLQSAIDRLIGLPAQHFAPLLDAMIRGGLVVEYQEDGRRIVYDKTLVDAERKIALKISDLMEYEPPWRIADMDETIRRVEVANDFTLGRNQREAVEMILTNPVSVMTGGPGVGKTTTLRLALDILSACGMNIRQCALAGMAAKRMREATGRPSSTIHRLLMVDAEGDIHNERDPIEADVIVADEFSMTDVLLAKKLLEAVRAGSAVIFVGDVDQLPSIGPGRVLHDIISSGVVPVTRLTEVYRQGKDSRIIQAAHAINRGEMPPRHDPGDGDHDFYFLRSSKTEDTLSTILKLATESVPSKFASDRDFDPIRDILVISAMRPGDVGIHRLNHELRQRLNPLPPEGHEDRYDLRYAPEGENRSYGVGDKVMNLVNKHKDGIVNGDIGYIRSIDKREKVILIDFDNGHMRSRCAILVTSSWPMPSRFTRARDRKPRSCSCQSITISGVCCSATWSTPGSPAARSSA